MVRGAKHNQKILRKISKRYQFTQGMWFEESGMTCFFLILRKIIKICQFTQGMWSEDPGMTKFQFET